MCDEKQGWSASGIHNLIAFFNFVWILEISWASYKLNLIQIMYFKPLGFNQWKIVDKKNDWWLSILYNYNMFQVSKPTDSHYYKYTCKRMHKVNIINFTLLLSCTHTRLIFFFTLKFLFIYYIANLFIFYSTLSAWTPLNQ